MSASWTAAVVLTGATRSGEVVTDPSEVSAGWIALVVILAIAAATVLLWLSMRKQLRKVRFEEHETPRRRRSGPPTT